MPVVQVYARLDTPCSYGLGREGCWTSQRTYPGRRKHHRTAPPMICMLSRLLCLQGQSLSTRLEALLPLGSLVFKEHSGMLLRTRRCTGPACMRVATHACTRGVAGVKPCVSTRYTLPSARGVVCLHVAIFKGTLPEPPFPPCCLLACALCHLPLRDRRRCAAAPNCPKKLYPNPCNVPSKDIGTTAPWPMRAACSRRTCLHLPPARLLVANCQCPCRTGYYAYYYHLLKHRHNIIEVGPWRHDELKATCHVRVSHQDIHPCAA